jgi:predicted HTH domain antitoxin
MTVVYPLKIRDDVMSLIELKSKEDHTNKAIVLKQMIYQSLEDYIIKLCAAGRLSVGRSAEILDCSIYDIYGIAKRKRIRLGATKEQREKSRKLLDRMTQS